MSRVSLVSDSSGSGSGSGSGRSRQRAPWRDGGPAGRRYTCAGHAVSDFLSPAGQLGVTCTMPNRGDHMDTRPLKVAFELGDAQFPFYNFNDETSVRQTLRNTDIVINLVGKHYETKHIVPTRKADGSLCRINCPFEKVNVDIPRRIAELCDEMGVRQLVHVSALAASPTSKSAWARTKYAGEEAVRSAFPSATIIRPAKMFGPRDRFLNWIAWLATSLPRYPTVGDGSALMQPAYVSDVAEAIISCIDNEWASDESNPAGRTVELAGSEEYSWDEVREFVYDVTGIRTPSVNVPPAVAEQLGLLIEQVPPTDGPLYTREDAIQQQESVMLSPNSSAMTFADFGIEPARMEEVAFSYLHRFREGGHFVRAKGYHG
jgi:NADH dehydrogenase (ubiquinone) 1 alpha subcomplex subunit 9